MNAIGWLCLVAAIAFEVGATMSLRMAVTTGRIWFVPVGAGYVLAFTALALALANGMPLGVAYGIWAAVGVAVIAILGRLVFKERFTWVMGVGVGLVAAGVLLVEVGSQH